MAVALVYRSMPMCFAAVVCSLRRHPPSHSFATTVFQEAYASDRQSLNAQQYQMLVFPASLTVRPIFPVIADALDLVLGQIVVHDTPSCCRKVNMRRDCE